MLIALAIYMDNFETTFGSFIILILLSLVGFSVALGLGIGGLFQGKKKKTFAALGTILAPLSIAVIILGSMILNGACG